MLIKTFKRKLYTFLIILQISNAFLLSIDTIKGPYYWLPSYEHNLQPTVACTGKLKIRLQLNCLTVNVF